MKTYSFQTGASLILNGRHYVIEACGSHSITLQDVESQETVVEMRASLAHAYRTGSLKFNDLLSDDGESEVVHKGLSEYRDRDRTDAMLKRGLLRNLCPNGALRVRGSELVTAIRETWPTLPGAQGRRPPSRATFYDWRRRWLRSDQRDEALVNRFDLRGRRPLPIPKDVAPIIEQAIDRVYLQNERGTIKDTLDHACALVDQHNAGRAVVSQLSRPTRRQIERSLEQIGRFERLRKRYGQKVAQTKTSMFGKGPGADRLLERVEIDHTWLNVTCIAEESMTIMGRPWLTVLVDVASRMVVGAVISFGTPNANTVLSALKQAILPKNDLLRRYKIKGEWPARGVMVTLVCDNGSELHSGALEAACQDLGVTLVFCPRLEPRYKGTVERFQKTINHGFVQTLPGTNFSSPKERGDYDSEAHAILTLEELRELLYKWIVEVYSQDYHRGIQAAPLQRWRELEKIQAPVLPRHPEVLDVVTRPLEQRTLSAKGIEINSQFYQCGLLEDLYRAKGSMKLSVRPDGSNLGAIEVLHPTTCTYFTATSSDPDYANGLTLEQHGLLRRAAREKYRALPMQSGARAAKRDMRDRVAALLAQREHLKTVAGKQPGGIPKKQRQSKVQASIDRAARLHSEVCDEPPSELPHAASAPLAFKPFDQIKAFPSGQTKLFP